MYEVCMVKRTTTLTVDSELMDEAKKENINISGLLEDSLNQRLGKIEIKINKPDKCEYCKIKPVDSWLYPDEKWICVKCLKTERSKRKLGI